jgi:hypothetical protein
LGAHAGAALMDAGGRRELEFLRWRSWILKAEGEECRM